MQELAQADSRVERMMQLESLFTRDPDLLRDYLKDLRDRLDYENSFKWARTDGFEQGRAEGEAKGRAEGMEETAAAMLREKIDILLVSKVTGLSLDRLKALQTRLES